MNGRERLLTTLEGNRADRVPVAPFLYCNSVYEMFRHKPEIETFWDPPDFDLIEKFVEYCDYFGFDVLHTLGSVWDFGMNTFLDRSVIVSAENWDVTIADDRRADSLHRTVTIHTPGGDLRHTENYRRSSTYLIVSAPEEYLIKSRRDFELFRKYAPAGDDMDCSLIRRARKAVGNKGLVDANTGGAFATLNAFRKLDDLYQDPVTDEVFYHEMIDYFVERTIRRDRKMVEAGADVIEVAGHLVGSMAGPRFASKYVMEYEKRLVKAIRDMGVPVIFHNCGDAVKVMHLYNDLDISCWGYLTPPPFGDVDLDLALQTMRPDMALRGNIDQVEFMP
ncbi:MAG: uroporphyrinogen decarboxylase family protein, partial [Candidatus Omnitrophica bacterium]|nr:uroporphyrinogen decarboxylase family protein [Candidatus Omnitrophota bacterium]